MRISMILVLMLSLAVDASAGYRGALVRKALVNGVPVNQAVPNGTLPYVQATFNEAVYDTDGLFDAATSSFVIPAGISYARPYAQAVWSAMSPGVRQIVILRKRTGETTWSFYTGSPVIFGVMGDQPLPGIVVPVQEGDRFALFPYQDSGTTVYLSGGTGTVFGIEVWP